MATIDAATTLQGLLKERYIGTMYNTIVNRTQVLDIFNETSAEIIDGPDGKYYKMAQLFAGQQGIGSRLEGQYLPESGTPQFLNPLVKLKYHYGRIDFTYQSMMKAVQGPSAFADFARVTLLPTVENLTDDLDRQACGFASGILCIVDGSPSGTTVNVGAPFGIGTASSTPKGWTTIKRGMQVVYGPNADGSGLRSSGQPSLVLSVDPTGNSGRGSFTVDQVPVDAASGDYVFRGDQYGVNVPVNGEEPELMGLEGFIDNGTVLDTLQNISRSSVPEWKSQVIDASQAPFSAAFTEGLMLKMITDALLFGNGRVDFFLCNNDVWRQAYNQLRTLSGFGSTRDTPQLKAGLKGITLYMPSGQVEFRAVPRTVVGRAYAIDSSTMGRAKVGDGEWVDQFGGSIFKQLGVGNAIKDAGYAYYRVPLQLFCTDPKKNVKATGIAETGF